MKDKILNTLTSTEESLCDLSGEFVLNEESLSVNDSSAKILIDNLIYEIRSAIHDINAIYQNNENV